ncbi:Protein DGCR6L [Plecturocebus cupreus]
MKLGACLALDESGEQKASRRPGRGPLHGRLGGGGGQYPAVRATLPAAVSAAEPGEGVAQQHLSYTTLSDLARAILEGTVFEIVQGLLGIQHLTKRACTTSTCTYRMSTEADAAAEAPGSPAGLTAPQPACAPGGSTARTRVEHWICEEQRVMDWKIVLELDQKLADQQSTLKKAEVAGFYVTTKLKELMLQMNLLEFIWKLQQRGCQAGKASSGLGGWWQPPAAQCDQEGSPVPP